MVPDHEPSCKPAPIPAILIEEVSKPSQGLLAVVNSTCPIHPAACAPQALNLLLCHNYTHH